MKLPTLFVLLLGTAVSALAMAPPPSVPDTASTAALLAMAVAGLLIGRRYLGK